MTHVSWGPGWPSCQVSKINRTFFVDTRWGRVTFPGGVRNEICELVSRLVKETSNRGYRFGVVGNPSYGCWGFACRAIRGSNSPSNHSWGLAVDINAPTNPMGSTLITNMPSWMPDLWNAYGFRWGGDYAGRKDAMHYEFMGSVADAQHFTELARKNRLGEDRSIPAPAAPNTIDGMVYPGPARMGDQGQKVRVWQRALQLRGYGNLSKVDGIYGSATRHNVYDFQRKHGLVADGIAGPLTWRKLASV